MAEKKKYNFKYGAGATRGQTDIAIYKGAPAYVSQKALKKFPFLMECKWVWGVDKEHGVLALKQDERGHGIMKSCFACHLYCPPQVARNYPGHYELEEQEDVLVLTPMQSM